MSCVCDPRPLPRVWPRVGVLRCSLNERMNAGMTGALTSRPIWRGSRDPAKPTKGRTASGSRPQEDALSLPECPRGNVLFRGHGKGLCLQPLQWLSLHILTGQQQGLRSKGHQPPSKGRSSRSSRGHPGVLRSHLP